MFRKKTTNTISEFHQISKIKNRQPNFVGEPYTVYPVPVSRSSLFYSHPQWQKVGQANYRKVEPKNARFTAKGIQSAETKYRNPGLININKKINLNEYNEQNIYGQAESIRKFGMNYRKKLQDRYNNSRINIYSSPVGVSKRNNMACSRELKNWYEQRNRNLQQMHLNYMHKIQEQLATGNHSRQEMQNILKNANMEWQDQSQNKLKKCFQS